MDYSGNLRREPSARTLRRDSWTSLLDAMECSTFLREDRRATSMGLRDLRLTSAENTSSGGLSRLSVIGVDLTIITGKVRLQCSGRRIMYRSRTMKRIWCRNWLDRIDVTKYSAWRVMH